MTSLDARARVRDATPHMYQYSAHEMTSGVFTPTTDGLVPTREAPVSGYLRTDRGLRGPCM